MRVLVGYAQNILETVTKPSHIFKYFRSIMKENIIALREYKEKGHILRWKPSLNLNKM